MPVKLKENIYLVKSMIHPVLFGFATCHNLRIFFPSFDLVKFYPSLPFPPFETHVTPL